MYEERVVLAGEVVYQLRFASPSDFRLACLKGGRVLVEYSSKRAAGVRSVEQLRYDFEREAEAALGQS